MAGMSERLARAEVKLEQIAENGHLVRSEMREHFEWQRSVAAEQEKRIAGLELGQKETRTHLNWMKGIWAAVQGVVLGWLGMR